MCACGVKSRVLAIWGWMEGGTLPWPKLLTWWNPGSLVRGTPSSDMQTWMRASLPYSSGYLHIPLPTNQFSNSKFTKIALGLWHVLKIEDLIVYCIFSVKFELCNSLWWPQDGILLRFSITHQQTRTTCSLHEKSWWKSLKKIDIRWIIADFSTWIHLENTFQPRTGLKVWL